MKEVCWNYFKEIWFQWASTSVARKTYAQNPDIVKSSVVQKFLGWLRNNQTATGQNVRAPELQMLAIF